jgi:hypothetical protein
VLIPTVIVMSAIRILRERESAVVVRFTCATFGADRDLHGTRLDADLPPPGATARGVHPGTTSTKEPLDP